MSLSLLLLTHALPGHHAEPIPFGSHQYLVAWL